MTDPFPRIEQILGCLLGGAIGDALGSAAEGQTDPPPFADLLAGPWALTDDTQLTLATCEAITVTGRVDPESIAASMLQWYRRGALTGLGSSTLKALRDLDAGHHWALAGRQGEYAAGNGAAMRIPPLAFVLSPASYEDRRTLRDVCRITHHSDEAYAGALAVVYAIHISLSNEPAGSLLSHAATQLPDTNVRDRLATFATLDKGVAIVEAAQRFGSSGYVVESVPLAIFAAEKCPEIGFESMLAQVIATGGDTDTNASIAAQIAGCRLGLCQLPAHWLERLPEREMLLRIGEAFAAGVQRHRG